MTRNMFPSESVSYAQADSLNADGTLTLNVENGGYFPAVLKAPANANLVLNLVTNQTYSCARDFVIPKLNYYALLPDTGVMQVNIPPQKSGSVIYFTCSMGMFTGQIIFE
jgi:plastocyanin domain-containing protein